MAMAGSDDLANPPIVELVLGVQFSQLANLKSGHWGLFWHDLGGLEGEWVDPADEPLLDDQFELFDRPRWRRPILGPRLRIEPASLPGRLMLGHRSGDRLLQLQATRFHLNWKKGSGKYPSYGELITQFEALFGQFQSFAEKSGLSKIEPNQWELTYVDAFALGEYWQTPADWPRILPGLFGNLQSAKGLELEHRAAEWSYEILPKQGRLHIAARPGRVVDRGDDVLLLQMTARGPLGKAGAKTLREGLDLGHRVAKETFFQVASDEAKRHWGKKE